VALGEVAVYQSVLLPLAFGGWIALILAGPIWATVASILGAVLWIAVVGVPAPASGSKIGGMGFTLTILSNAVCIVTSLVILANQLIA
jgi:hypothetical protein